MYAYTPYHTLHTQTNIHLHTIHTDTHTHAYIHAHIHRNICTQINTHVYTYTNKYTHIRSYTQASMIDNYYTRGHPHDIQILIHVYTHMHIKLKN